MTLNTVVLRSLKHYWRTHVAVALGVAAAAAALAGALLVGDSMRASLRDLAMGRLGAVDYALVAQRFFNAELAGSLCSGESDGVATAAPAILLTASATSADTGRFVGRINLFGVDERFWAMSSDPGGPATADAGRGVVLNAALARELGLAAGDDIVLRIARPQRVSPETLLGRRDDSGVGRRVRVHKVVPDEGMGRFGLTQSHATPSNAYLGLAELQRLLDRAGQANMLLAVGTAGTAVAPDVVADRLSTVCLKRGLRTNDAGFSVIARPKLGYAALESASFLVEPAIERAVDAAGLTPEPVLTYLANRIATPDREVPYSVVAAVGPETTARFETRAGTSTPGQGDIVVNEWTARALGVTVGAPVTLTFYITAEFGRLEIETHTFTCSGIVALSGAAADRGFTPYYPGVTDAESMTAWDPPFPVDLKRIGEADEAYWDDHGATPKAFVSLEDGLRLWAHDAERFGRYTSLRFALPPAGATAPDAFARDTGHAILEQLDPGAVGLRFEAVRALAEQASTGSTDFGGLFIGFSFFLIIAAALLVALLFRLSVERRSAQLGTLLAIGWTPRLVRRTLLREGVLVALVGAALGGLAAIAYAEVMLHGLRSWWSQAVNAPFLVLTVHPMSILIGCGVAVVVAVAAIRFSTRNVTTQTPRALMGGAGGFEPVGQAPARKSLVAAVVLAGLAITLAVLPEVSPAPRAVMFFLSGMVLLAACLCAVRFRLRARAFAPLTRGGGATQLRLGGRNTHRNPARSGLTIALIGSATFVIFALQAFRVDELPDPADRNSGAGGYAVVAESAVPVLVDLNAADGRRDAGLSDAALAAMATTQVMPFRLQPGDDASCLNLFKPSSHRIIGATATFIDRGGFRFAASTAAEDGGEVENPWTLLDRHFDDGAIPVIGDLNAVQWQLHSGLNKTIEITDGRGAPRKLRFVALLADSLLQDELVVSESDFVRLFPGRSGYGFFLIDTAAADAIAVNDLLERELSSYGFDGVTSSSRMTAFRAVQNTYLSTFQALGGVGLIIGTVGLGAVLLRNVLERRRELALMQAVGFTRSHLAWMVLAENVLLVAGGLACGLISALIAIAPHIYERANTVAWGTMGLLTAVVFAVGVLASALALVPALSGSLIPALRRE